MTYTIDEIIKAKRVLADIEAYEIYARLKSIQSPEKVNVSYIGGKEISQLLEFDRKSLTRWRDTEGLPCSPGNRNKFNLAAVVRWFQVHKASRWRRMDPVKRSEIEELIKKTS